MDKCKNSLNKDHSIVYNPCNIITICECTFCKYSSRTMILKLDETFEPIGELFIYLFIKILSIHLRERGGAEEEE